MRPVPAVPPSDRVRILIADRDRFFADMLRAALARHDEFDVVGIAGTPAETLEQAQALKPSVVVMDAEMPSSDESDVMRRLSELGEAPTVVLVVGEASRAADTSVYDPGAAAYVRRSQEILSVIDIIVALAHPGVAPA
jgi:DNA-binding NarL/FixJ family response regulator